ncbi:unnamed protein product [Sphagnum tenellum]
MYSSSTMPFSRSQSVKIPVEHGSAAVERFASRPSSRLKTRNRGEEFPADLQDDDAPHLHQYARDREGRTKSRGGGGRNGVDIADLDAFDGYGAAAAAPIKEGRASSRSSSRMKGRSSSRDAATAAAAAVGSYTGLQQEDKDLQLGASNIVVRSANGMDMADVEGYLSYNWVAVDLIMWRDIPRSALWFGAGSFIILSTSFMPRIRCGLIGIGANFALFYLAAVFIYRMFIPGSAAQLSEDNVGTGCCTTEADIARWIRIFLPAINLVLTKTRQVFSGDPATTLKVAAVLWLLARAGSRMSLWSFVRLCYFGVFTVPKCCNCYSNQLQAHVRAWIAWSTYSHKKAVLVAAFLLAWNMSSFSTRLWGGFMMLVWLRLYQQSHPLVFEEAVSDVSCSMGAIDLSNHQEILQQTIKAKPESVEDARQQEHPAALVKMEQVQKFPGREVNSHIYKA